MNTLLNSCLLNTLDRKGLEDTELSVLLGLDLEHVFIKPFALIVTLWHCDIVTLWHCDIVYRWKVKTLRDVGGRADSIGKWLFSKSGEWNAFDANQVQLTVNSETVTFSVDFFLNTQENGVILIIDWKTLVESAGNYCRGAEMCPDSSSPRLHPRSCSSTSSPSPTCCWASTPSSSWPTPQSRPTRGGKL